LINLYITVGAACYDVGVSALS